MSESRSSLLAVKNKSKSEITIPTSPFLQKLGYGTGKKIIFSTFNLQKK